VVSGPVVGGAAVVCRGEGEKGGRVATCTKT